MQWQQLGELQAGVVSRRQALAGGLSAGKLRWLLESGQWVVLVPGVYATFTGSSPPAARVWAAVLHAGPGACAAGRTALWLWGFGEQPGVLEVAVPVGRRIVAYPGTAMVEVARLGDAVHPTAGPPRLRVEEAVLDCAQRCTRDREVIGIVLEVVQRRASTPDRLADALARRPRHRRRRLLVDLLGEAADGVQSPLELRWAVDVERRHGLPVARRNAPESTARGTRYRDVEFVEQQLVVELDGRQAHRPATAHRDHARDNAIMVLGGRAVLRYGWVAVACDPCGTAGQTAAALAARGWRGTVRRCGPGCSAPEASQRWRAA